MSKVETRFDTKTALAVANSIYRKKGYVKTTEADYGDRKSNKTLVLEELAKENPKYAKKDVTAADEIIEHYQGLLLFRLGDQQNNFQETVLSCVANETIRARDIGILASLPHTYKTTFTPFFGGIDDTERENDEESRSGKSWVVFKSKATHFF